MHFWHARGGEEDRGAASRPAGETRQGHLKQYSRGNDIHHVAGKDMCGVFFRLSVFEAE
jgi:hypothetical protein